MNKCPSCREELPYLHEVHYGMALVEEYNGENWEEVELRETPNYKKYWECPFCNETLFYNLEDARKFLQSDE